MPQDKRPTAEKDAPTQVEVIEAMLETHRPADNWHCACGADLFGGTAAYSWSLFKAHAAESIIAALSVIPPERSTDAG